MHSSRLVSIPIDHVVAEVAAFPLASEAAFALGLSALDLDLSPPTARLWRQAERHLLGGFPAFSVDEVVAMRDTIWFHQPQPVPQTMGGRPFHLYLQSLAQQFLARHGTSAVPILPLDERPFGVSDGIHAALARQRWRWLALALPPDLLLAALAPPDETPETIVLLSPTLDRHLCDHGYAETHLHMGAAMDFPLLWVAALHALADPVLQEASFRSPGAALDEGRLFGPWLIRAALARYLLAAYLAWGCPGESFAAFLDTEARQHLTRDIGAGAFALLLHGLADLHTGVLAVSDFPFSRWQGFYAELTGLTRGPALDRLEQVQDADPIAPLFPRRQARSWPEVYFVSTALAYLAEVDQEIAAGVRQQPDTLFTALFWQMVRVRGLFYRHMVQRPMTPGLQWFIRFYGRLSPARRPLTRRALLESAAVIGGVGRGLRSLEVRCSPEHSRTELRESVVAAEHTAAAWPRLAALTGNGPPDMRHPLEIGLVFHFTKDRGGGARGGMPQAHWNQSHADPVGNPTTYRYASYYLEKYAEALTLAALLRDTPLTLALIRGLDVCTDELGVPNWALAPLLAHVRTAAEGAAVAARRLHGRSLPVLRMTAHAGEDFVHLLTGLRYVDEAIEYFPLREGDRIGHGMALGVDARAWAQRAGRLPMLREERLFDLVWEWSWYGREGGGSDRQRQQLLEYEIAAHSARLFDDPIAPYDIQQLIQDLFTSDTLFRMAGFPAGPPPPDEVLQGNVSLRRVCRYLRDRTLFERGREVVWVEPVTEADALAYLQGELRRKVGVRGIAVEVNPTSNLLIGDLGDLTTHPLWRLRSPRPGSVDVPPVSICIGSDDPVVFGSDLRQEYQCLSDAMALAGLSDEEARQWLDRTRACGLESRFTLNQVT